MGVKSPIRQQLEQKQYCLLHYFREIQVEQITQKHHKMKNNAGQEITIVHIYSEVNSSLLLKKNLRLAGQNQLLKHP